MSPSVFSGQSRNSAAILKVHPCFSANDLEFAQKISKRVSSSADIQVSLVAFVEDTLQASKSPLSGHRVHMHQPAANQPSLRDADGLTSGQDDPKSGEPNVANSDIVLESDSIAGLHSDAPENRSHSTAVGVTSVVSAVGEWLKSVLCSRDDRRFLLFACGLSLLVLTLRYSWLAWHRPEPLHWDSESKLLAFQVDVNVANWPEWIQLEGIGRETAIRIIEDRETNGPFLSIDDVGRVAGIGPTTLDRIRSRLTIDNDEFPEWPNEVGSDVGSNSEKVLDQSNAEK